MLTAAVRRAILLSACVLGISAHAVADSPKHVNVPAGELTRALEELGKQAGVEFVYSVEQLKGLHTNGVQGEFTAQKAVLKLLDGTDLTLVRHHSGALLIGSPPVADTSRSSSSEPIDRRSSSQDPESSRRLRLAQADRREAGVAGASGSHADTQRHPTGIEEIVVTAQKREERLSEVPVPVTAIAADELRQGNLLRLQDYFTRVPGFILSTDSRGAPVLAIRGISTAATPTVAITVDDVPYGASSILGVIAPDFDPSEIDRIEVLRGPQGTLYGANSMGGLVKYVTLEPSMDGYSGRLEAAANHVSHASDPGYVVRGAVNVPLSDVLAVRVSGSARRDAGYIDDPGLGLKDVNSRDARTGRISLLWHPSETTTLRLNGLLQDSERDGSPYAFVQPGLADLQQQNLRGTGWYKADTQVYSANLSTRFGKIDAVSLTGYNVDSWSTATDFTPSFGGLPTAIPERAKTEKFTQEVRLSSSLTPHVDWLLGAYYADETTDREQDIFRIDPITGESTATLALGELPSTFREYAAFGTVTLKLTDRFDVQLGGRAAHDEQTQESNITRPPAAPTILQLDVEEDSFTYLVAPRFRITPETMVYARVATGYRAGGANVNGPTFGLPPQYDPDDTTNYEVGIKGALADRRLSYDMSVYRIDWQDIQVQLFDPTTRQAYLTNAGAAKSEGYEIALEARPFDGLTLAGWWSYNDAELTEAFPPSSLSFGRPGDRLPFGSRESGSISADQEFTIRQGVTGSIGTTINHVGKRIGNFTATPTRRVFPEFTQVDLRAGIKFDVWAFNLFAVNVGDERGELATGQSNPLAFNYVQPRTIGFNLSRDF